MATAVAQAKPRPGERPKTAPHVVGFVFHLELKRIELGLALEPFAELLGIDRSVYYEIRWDKTRPTWHVLKRVLELWPGEFDAELAEVIRVWGASASGA